MAAKTGVRLLCLAAFCLPALANVPVAGKARLGGLEFAPASHLASAVAKPLTANGIATCLCDFGRRSRSTGKERDQGLMEASMDYFGARYMSAAMGRFTSPDPFNLGARLRNPQSWNMYAYGLNNPQRYVDPTGLWPTAIHNHIIRNAFPGLSADQKSLLMKVSRRQDGLLNGGQGLGTVHGHAMRRVGQSVADAKRQYDTFVAERRAEAQRLHAEGQRLGSAELQAQALAVFGELLHAVTDETSPSHEGFQAWDWTNLNYSDIDSDSIFKHIARESYATRNREEKAVSAAQNAFRDTFGDSFYFVAVPNPKPRVTTRIRFDLPEDENQQR